MLKGGSVQPGFVGQPINVVNHGAGLEGGCGMMILFMQEFAVAKDLVGQDGGRFIQDNDIGLWVDKTRQISQILQALLQIAGFWNGRVQINCQIDVAGRACPLAGLRAEKEYPLDLWFVLKISPDFFSLRRHHARIIPFHRWRPQVEFDIVGASVKRYYSRVLLAVGGALLMFGCRRSQGPEVAKVGSASITVEDFKSRLQGTPPAYQQYTATPEGRRQFLNLLIREKVLIEEARKAGLQKDENYRAAVSLYKKKSESDLRDYQDGLLVEMTLARLRSKDITVTDAEVRRYYDAHAEDFSRPLEVQASHILVTSPQDADNALTRLKNGESFEAVARAVSMDPATAARGGKLAPFTRGSLMPEFENAVIPLKEGQISGAVKSSFGYHVIKKTGQRTLPARAFEASKEDIRNRLQREKFDQWITRTQASLGVKIDEKALAAVAAASGAPEGGGGPVR